MSLSLSNMLLVYINFFRMTEYINKYIHLTIYLSNPQQDFHKSLYKNTFILKKE